MKKIQNLKFQITWAMTGFAFLIIFLLSFVQISMANESIVKKINVKGNTLIDKYVLEEHFELGNGLIMDPHIMDLVISELKAVYRYYGYPDIDTFAVSTKKANILILKINEEREYKYGAARAKLAIDNLDWNFNIKTSPENKKKIIKQLIKGYKKIKLNEEVVNNYLIKSQRTRIEEIESAKRTAMRKKIAKAARIFKENNIAEDKNWEEKIKKMRDRIQLLGQKKEIPSAIPKIVEYGEITPVERSQY